MVNDDAIDSLRRQLGGTALTAADPDYAEAGGGYNLAVVHTPDLIVEATSAADVSAAVAFAAAHGLPVSVQATGHGVTERMSDGVLISTRRMQDLHVDPESRIARVAAGVRWKSVLAEAVPHGLGGLCGSSPDVGVVGFTLGGGLPILGRAFGFAADRVRAFEVVTPDAAIRTVDAEHEAELFEVLRGGKGNFGIVTAMEFELLPITDFYGGGLMYPGEDAAAVFTAFRSWVAELPDHACPSISLLRLPDAPFIPDALRGQFLVHLRFAVAGTQEEGERLLAPMRAVSTVVMDAAGPLGYEQLELVNMDPPDPLPYQEGGALLGDIDDEAQAAFLEAVGPGAQTPLLMAELRPMGGALAQPSAGRDAVGGRDAAYSMLGIGVLVPPVADLVPGGIAALLEAMRPWATGHTMVNFHGHAGDATDRARAWPPEIYATLEQAKRRYDPDNMMRFGHALMLPSQEPVDATVPL